MKTMEKKVANTVKAVNTNSTKEVQMRSILTAKSTLMQKISVIVLGALMFYHYQIYNHRI